MVTARRERLSGPGFWGLLCLLALLLLFGVKQELTGDEPRYLMYAAAFWKTGHLSMSEAEWQRLYFDITGEPARWMPVPSGHAPLNGVYLPVLLSPVAGVFSLAGLRLVSLVSGVVGLVHLHRLCRRVSPPGAALLAVAVAALTIPMLPYLHLFYMETFLFALICCAWERLQTVDRGAGGDLVTALVILALPFVHLRGSVVAALLFGLLLWQLHVRGSTRRAMALAALGAAALALLVALNVAIYGAVAGSVNFARPASPGEWFPIVAMQLFNVRHGLIAYAPIWLLGYAGLLTGGLRGSRIAWQGGALAFIVAVTAMGPNPGECWPARFWVQSLPMLAVGFGIWWDVARTYLLRGVTIFLLGLSLVNTAMFVSNPDQFIANRQTAVTYQSLYDSVGHFHFGLILPVEVDDPHDQAVARNFAIGAGLFVLLASLAAARRRSAYAVPAVLLLVAFLDLARVRPVSPASYQAQIEPDRLKLTFNAPMRAGYLRFGRDWEMWHVYPNWQTFEVSTGTGDGHETRTVLAANQVISLSSPRKIDTITIENKSGFNLAWEANYRLQVYRSASLLRRWFPTLLERSDDGSAVEAISGEANRGS